MSDQKNEIPQSLDEIQDRLFESSRELAKKLPILGNVVFLYQNSQDQRYLFFRDIEHRLMPPLMIDQFKLYLDSKSGGMPLAFVSWAYLSEEAEQAYMKTQRIAPKDWKSGENLWLIDTVTPYAKGNELFQQVYDELFRDKDVHVLYPNGQGGYEKKTLVELAQEISHIIPDNLKQ